ncbi:MAG: helix-turn-helix domain-containing protein [Phycisphaerales bacterium]|nr:helix-turn-helix domain-containing protein [Phycisphaerales bacterium]
MKDQSSFTDKDVLTTGEVAKVCNVASRTVSKWFDSGQLRGYRIPGSKDRRIPVTNLLAFMKKHSIPMDGLMSGNPRVLVLDGDASASDMLRKVLSEQTRFEVRCAMSSFAAGCELERFRPHVLLVDLHLPEVESGVLMSFVRHSDDLQMTRVIGVSGKLTDGQMSSMNGKGFDCILRKPFTVRQVVDAIEHAHAFVA